MVAGEVCGHLRRRHHYMRDGALGEQVENAYWWNYNNYRDVKGTPQGDPYASLRISLQEMWRDFHAHYDHQRSR